MNSDRPATPETPSTGDAPPESHAPQPAWERFLLAMHGANDGYYDWDLLTGEVYLSPRWKELIGYSDAELPNRFETWVELLHPEDREQATATTHRLLAGALSQYQIEYRLRHKDGSYRLVRSCGAILRDAAGKPIRLGGWHIDLSENKRLTERLQQQTHVANMCTDVSLALARQPFLRVFLQHCVDALLAHLPLDWVGIWLHEPGRHGFIPQVRASRAPNAHNGEYDLPVGAQTVGRIADLRQRLLSQEVQRDPLLHPQERAWAQREGMSVFVGYPLLAEGRVAGVLALFAREPLPEVYLDALGSLALIIALASERLPAQKDLP
ncbi:MAG: PAS domain S-box protein [Chloroflexi bacterium]|nr:MAG: PAS domain S-box protein [Chloroflexota bacterium]